MKLPAEFLSSLQGLPGFDREHFVAVHEAPQPPTSVRVNPAKPVTDGSRFHLSRLTSHVPWCSTGYYLSQRPSFTFDPLFHAGCYYVQEASSMFLEQAIRQLLDGSKPVKVLDLCAAPGGKSTHLQSLLSKESLLVSNEVIKPRSLVLTDNVIKWGCSNVFVSNNDPKAFQKLPAYFDAMVVDAPCSGSGLFRKDPDAVDEWSLNNVALCSQRQQRILADVLPALKEGALLVYSTCSYSAAEDEAIADWLVTEMGMESLSLDVQNFEGIVQTSSPQAGAVGYRFYPDKLAGEGFFMACFRKKSEEESVRWKTAKPEILPSRQKAILHEWVEAGEAFEFLRFRNEIFALPQNLIGDFAVLQSALNLQYAGVQLGEIMKERLVPHHALALSNAVSKSVPSFDLSLEEAIKYLQRQELSALPPTTGWQTVSYCGHRLGWINALKNRVNNYYPKELRILKQQHPEIDQ